MKLKGSIVDSSQISLLESEENGAKLFFFFNSPVTTRLLEE